MRTWWPCVIALFGCATTPEQRTAARAEALMAAAPQRTGDLELHCDPEDATVSVDGVPQGTCEDFDGDPARLSLGTGMHRIDVNKDGFLAYQTYYEPSGARAVLNVALQPAGKMQGEAP